MRWTRLLSWILGTGTSTTCFPMRSETRSRVCDSLLIDGTVFRSVTVSRESAQIAPAVPRHGLAPDLWWAREHVLVAKLRRCFVDLRFRNALKLC